MELREVEGFGRSRDLGECCLDVLFSLVCSSLDCSPPPGRRRLIPSTPFLTAKTPSHERAKIEGFSEEKREKKGRWEFEKISMG